MSNTKIKVLQLHITNKKEKLKTCDRSKRSGIILAIKYLQYLINNKEAICI